MKVTRIPTLSTYSDWLEKARYELRRFEESCGVYDMANCFLTLNAIPEWIEKSDTSPAALREVAKSKIAVMKGQGFELDITKIDEIDHQLRLIRLFCNHSKHGGKKEEFEHISMCSTFPLTFPVKFELLQVGPRNVRAADILNDVIHFWAGEIESA